MYSILLIAWATVGCVVSVHTLLHPCVDPRAIKPLSAGSESEETLSASEGEGQGVGPRLHHKSPKASSGQTVMTFGEAAGVTRRRDDLSGPTLGELSGNA